MAKTYGMPYKGSKSKIANKILSVLPDAEYFVDLFGGGGAMSHAAAVSGKFKRVIYNEIDTCVFNGFKKAISGEYKNENRWISQEAFYELKGTDFYAAACFSFGSTLKDYAYSKEIEPWKRALHYARVLNDRSEFAKFGINTDGSREDIKAHHDEYKGLYIKWYLKAVLKSEKEYTFEKEELEKNIKTESEKLRAYLSEARNAAGLKSVDIDKHLGTNGMAGHYFGSSQWEFPTREAYNKMREIMPTLEDYEKVAGLALLWQSLESLQRLESLERLQSLESLQRLQRLQIQCINKSYEDVRIPENAVVYCDIPYQNTDKYVADFDHEKFYGWARNAPFRVYISEYTMPEDFLVVWEKAHISTLSATNNNRKTIERIFANR